MASESDTDPDLASATRAAVAPRHYRRLDAAQVVVTIERLLARIQSRFPDRSLSRVADELADVVAGAAEAADRRSPRERNLALLCRALAWVVIALAVTALFLSVRDATDRGAGTPAFQWLPVIESAINDVVFAGIAVYFLHSVPRRRERARVLAVLHTLRSLAHVVDMHQLTKDPERLRPDFVPTEESPTIGLSADELSRYLDYCSELLSLIGKAAAMQAQVSTDAVVLDTVSEIETLTVGMSRKIWQKISLLHGR